MIIRDQSDVTTAVLAEMHRTPDARTREVLAALVHHLHAFVRETRLTELEFQDAIRLINGIGQATTSSHNEAMLMAGALGVSNLVCLLNNGEYGTRETQANNLGPFWRDDAPQIADGDSILRSATPGESLWVTGWVHDSTGVAVADARVDVWQSTPAGLYENQDPTQAEMNLRGSLMTQADGSFRFRSVLPGAYPVPITGPTGVLLAAQSRHNWRPAHLHFLIHKPGFKTIASQVYRNDDQYLETDSQFGVTTALIGNFVRHQGAPAPAAEISGDWYSLDHRFMLERGDARLPKAPISSKVTQPK